VNISRRKGSLVSLVPTAQTPQLFWVVPEARTWAQGTMEQSPAQLQVGLELSIHAT